MGAMRDWRRRRTRDVGRLAPFGLLGGVPARRRVGGDFRLTYPASLAGTVTSTVDGPMVSDARDLRIIDALGR